MTVTFWLAALLLSVLAAVFLLLPLWRRGHRTDADRVQVNVELFEDRLAELEAARDAGELDVETFEALRVDLQRNLLTETTGSESAAPDDDARRSRLPLVMAAVVPLAAIFLYADFGLSLGALDEVDLARSLQQLDTRDQRSVEQAVSRLAATMEKQPENDQGWFMLANSWMNLGDYDRAAAAFDHLLSRYPNDGRLLGSHAEALFMAEGQALTPEVKAAVERTLAIDPDNVSMLELMGMEAFRGGRLESAMDWFNRALAATPSGERKAMIERAIGAVEAVMRERGMTPPSLEMSESGSQRAIDVWVDVAANVTAAPDATVFVFARAESGPPMPLAVKRLRLDQLPTRVTLDESMAMMDGVGLAQFDRVQVVARVSASGTADVTAGDYEAMSNVVDVSAGRPEVRLTISDPVR